MNKLDYSNLDKLLVNESKIIFKKENLTKSLSLNDDGMIEYYSENKLTEKYAFSKSTVQKLCNDILTEGYTIYTTIGEDGVYTSNEYDTVDNEDRAIDTVAELKAQGINASYVKNDEEDTDNNKYVLFNPHNDKYLQGYPDEFCDSMQDAMIFDSFQEAEDFWENRTYNDEDAPKDITDWKIVEYEDIIQESVDQNLDNNISDEELDTQISNTEQAIEKIDQLQGLKDELMDKVNTLTNESLDINQFPTSAYTQEPISLDNLMSADIKSNLNDMQINWIETNLAPVEDIQTAFINLLQNLDFENNDAVISICQYVEALNKYKNNEEVL